MHRIKMERLRSVSPQIRSIARRQYGQDAEDAMQGGMLAYLQKGDPGRVDGEIISFFSTAMRRHMRRGQLRGALAADDRRYIDDRLPNPERQIIMVDLLAKIDRRCCWQIRHVVNILLVSEVMTLRAAAKAVGWREDQLSKALAELGEVMSGQSMIRQHRCDYFAETATAAAGQMSLWGGGAWRV